MNWTHMQRYRLKAVPGQVQVERNEKTKTLSVQVLCEVQAGPLLGQRLRWRGYLNSPANQENAIAELRVMGWRGAKLGDWQGIGGTEFEATALREDNLETGKTYWRLAWPRPLATLKSERAVKGTDLDALNSELGGLLAKPADAAKLPAPATPVDEGGDEQIPF